MNDITELPGRCDHQLDHLTLMAVTVQGVYSNDDQTRIECTLKCERCGSLLTKSSYVNPLTRRLVVKGE
jgi:hypothetical protein